MVILRGSRACTAVAKKISTSMIGRTSRPVSSTGRAITAASSSPARRESATSEEFWPTTRTRTSG